MTADSSPSPFSTDSASGAFSAYYNLINVKLILIINLNRTYFSLFFNYLIVQDGDYEMTLVNGLEAVKSVYVDPDAALLLAELELASRSDLMCGQNLQGRRIVKSSAKLGRKYLQ